MISTFAVNLRAHASENVSLLAGQISFANGLEKRGSLPPDSRDIQTAFCYRYMSSSELWPALSKQCPIVITTI